MAQPTVEHRWWLKRIALATILLLAMTLVIRLIAGVVSNRRDAALAARMKAHGFALHMAELAPPQVPDSDNAAPIWVSAIAALEKVDSPRSSNFESTELGQFPPYKAKWHELADASEAANGQAFALAERAANLPRCNWGTSYGRSRLVTSAVPLSKCRDLANHLVDSAERAWMTGDSATGMDRLLATLRFATDLRTDPLLINHLVANGIESIACRELRSNIASLDISDGPRAIRPAEVATCIRLLLAVDHPDAASHALASETTMLAEPDVAGWPTSAWVLAPNIDSLRRGLIDAYATLSIRTHRAAAAPHAQATMAAILALAPAADPDEPADIKQLREFAIYGATPDSAAFMLRSEQSIQSQRGVAAIALAIRWYQADHAGALPSTLNVLVPKYVPFIPVNELSAAGTPFEYVVFRGALPDGRDRPMLFVEMSDQIRSTPTTLPTYDLYLNVGRIDRSQGRWSDLTSWTPTDAMLEAEKQLSPVN